MFSGEKANPTKNNKFLNDPHSTNTSERIGIENFFSRSFKLFAPCLADHITRNYGVQISFIDLPGHAQAIFDGGSIQLNNAINPEKQVFLMLHLTGHAYQLGALGISHEFEPEGWINGGYFIFEPEFFNLHSDPNNESRVRQFEIEASRYGAFLLVELDKTEMLPWFEAQAARDLEYFINFLKTGNVDFNPTDIRLNPLRLNPLRLQAFEPIHETKGVII